MKLLLILATVTFTFTYPWLNSNKPFRLATNLEYMSEAYRDSAKDITNYPLRDLYRCHLWRVAVFSPSFRDNYFYVASPILVSEKIAVGKEGKRDSIIIDRPHLWCFYYMTCDDDSGNHSVRSNWTSVTP